MKLKVLCARSMTSAIKSLAGKFAGATGQQLNAYLSIARFDTTISERRTAGPISPSRDSAALKAIGPTTSKHGGLACGTDWCCRWRASWCRSPLSALSC